MNMFLYKHIQTYFPCLPFSVLYSILWYGCINIYVTRPFLIKWTLRLFPVFAIIDENVYTYINLKIYLSRINFQKWNCLIKRQMHFKSICVASLPSHTVVAVQHSHQQCRKAPFFDTLSNCKFFIFFNLICEQNISHCLIQASSFKEEANCSKINSSHESIFNSVYALCSATIVSADFTPWYSQYCQVRKMGPIQKSISHIGE